MPPRTYPKDEPETTTDTSTQPPLAGRVALVAGSLYYDLAKASVIRLAVAQAAELRAHSVAAVAASPGIEDVDGSRPDWGAHFEREVLPELGGG